MLSSRLAAIALVACSGSAAAGEMTFELKGNGGNCAGCEWVAAEGEITAETPARFRAFADKNGGVPAVRLNSPGGNLVAALELGMLIREAQAATEVGRTLKSSEGWWSEKSSGQCASACAFAFLGGIRRDAMDAEIGVHQFYRDVALERPTDKVFDALDLSADQYLTALLIDYTFRMGVDPRFVAIAAQTSPGGMRYLSGVEARELKVAYDPGETGPWQLEPWAGGAVAFARSLDEQVTMTLFCKTPGNARLLVTSKVDFGPDALRPVEEYTSAVDVFGRTVPASAVSLKQAGDEMRLEIRLGAFDPAEIVDVDGKLHVDASPYAPHVNWSLFDASASSENAVAAMRVALRACI